MRENKSTYIQKAARLALVSAVLFSFSLPALADQFDDQIAALRQQVAGQQSQLNSLKGQEDTLANKVAILNAQITANEEEMQLAQAKYEQLTQQIADNAAKLAVEKDLLNENVRAIYTDGQVSTLELLVSSSGIGEYLDRRQALQSVKDKISDSMASITALKADLEKQQKQQADTITQQHSLQFGLDQQHGQVSDLLSQTQGLESNYQSQIATNKQQISKLQQQQAAAIAARSSGSNYGGTGGYPWAGYGKDSGADPWGFYYRECTSYGAWRRANLGRPIPAWGRMGYADAKTWPDWARGSGLKVDNTPEVGAIAVFTFGQYGHIMIVERINGSYVHVSQYNADMTGRYSESDVRISDVSDFIH